MATGTWKWARWVLSGCVALGGAAAAWAGDAQADRIAIMLKYKPSQEGVVYTMPKPEEEAGLKIELFKRGDGGNGWMLKDANGKPLRLFYNSNPTPTHNAPDTWAYYKDGVEVYRETEGETKSYAGRPDQFRWMNGAGMKWGIDEAKEGHIKHWKMISAEEVSQEILQALAANDFPRLQTLMITDAEMTQLGLPAEETARIRQLEKAAPEKFQKTIKDLPKLASGKPTWVHLETSAPECTPPDPAGPKTDVLKYSHGSILFEAGGSTDWVQTGEMIRVGDAWRIIDGPTAGAAPAETAGGPPEAGHNDAASDPKLAALINELTELDKKTPDAGAPPNPAMARHHLARTDILEKIVAAAKGDAKDPWQRQIADSLATAAQNAAAGDTAAMKRLVKLEEDLAKAAPGGNLAAYVTYRELQADYAVRMMADPKGQNIAKAQQEWVDRLAKFVDAYPQAEDTPDVLLQLGMVNEFLNEEVKAKNWYGVLAKNFPGTPQAAKAQGAVTRLGMEGQAFHLAGPTLADPNTTYNVEQAQGKVVVVYYWASWNNQSSSDFTKLKALADAQGKNVEVVCVSLDNTPKEARDFLASVPAVGVHLYQSGGMDSKPAVDYGITVLPSLFLVGKDGKVVSRNEQIGNVEEDVKKLLK
jgi:hypothetical protein